MRRIRIVYKSPIAEFANLAYTYREAIYRLWVITPWIGMYTDGSVDPLGLLIDAVRDNKKCVTNVITREPRSTWHEEALGLLRANIKPTLFFCNTLHTKLYIIETDGMTAVMLGSPNLTPGGNTANIELALELRTTSLTRADDVSLSVRDLVTYAFDLLKDDAVTLATT